MSFPRRTSVRSSMQINCSKEGIVFWLAVQGKEAMIDLKAKLFLYVRSALPRNKEAKEYNCSLL